MWIWVSKHAKCRFCFVILSLDGSSSSVLLAFCAVAFLVLLWATRAFCCVPLLERACIPGIAGGPSTWLWLELGRPLGAVASWYLKFSAKKKKKHHCFRQSSSTNYRDFCGCTFQEKTYFRWSLDGSELQVQRSKDSSFAHSVAKGKFCACL